MMLAVMAAALASALISTGPTRAAVHVKRGGSALGTRTACNTKPIITTNVAESFCPRKQWYWTESVAELLVVSKVRFPDCQLEYDPRCDWKVTGTREHWGTGPGEW